MDADGVRRAFVLSTAYLLAADAYGSRTSEAAEQALVRLENDFTAAECARYPDRLVPFLSVNPKRGYAVEEVDRCAALKMRGLKLHLWNSLVDTRQAADLDALRRVVERAAHHRLAIVAHILVGAVPGYGPDDTERFVCEIMMPFDTLQISLAHLGGAGGFAARERACFERLIAVCGPDTPYASRVWMDMSAVLSANSANEARWLGELLPRWGLHRVLWGATTSRARSSSRMRIGHSTRPRGVGSPSSAARRWSRKHEGDFARRLKRRRADDQSGRRPYTIAEPSAVDLHDGNRTALPLGGYPTLRLSSFAVFLRSAASSAAFSAWAWSCSASPSTWVSLPLRRISLSPRTSPTVSWILPPTCLALPVMSSAIVASSSRYPPRPRDRRSYLSMRVEVAGLMVMRFATSVPGCASYS
jgi:predicted TIM-barrel fold metal-dependent hydrolase